MVRELDPHVEAAVCDFVEILAADRRRGSVRRLADYLAMFPDHQERIAREFLAATAERVSGEVAGGPALSTVEQVGGYRLKSLLGRGGQGAVYLAEDLRLQRDVALKILPPQVTGVDSLRVERLRREAAILARLDHPGVCAVYEAGLTGACPFLAMRFVPGETLAARIKAAATDTVAGRMLSRLPRTRAEVMAVLQFVERAAYALHAAHTAGTIHRDVKPANIMVNRDEMPVIVDFGLARDIADPDMSLTMTGEVFGSVAYMSPEQLAGEDLDARTDVYSLGVTLHECLTLAIPFRKDTREVLDRAIRQGDRLDPAALNPAIPRDLRIVMGKAMEPDRDRRYASTRAFADDLANVRERRPIDARSAGVWLRLWRWQQRHPVIAVAVGLLWALLLAMGWALWRLDSEKQRLTAWQRMTDILQHSEDRPAEALWVAVEAARGEEQHQLREALHTILLRNHESWRSSDRVASYAAPAAADAPDELLTGQLVAGPGQDTFLCPSNHGRIHVLSAATGRLLTSHQIHRADRPAQLAGRQIMVLAASHDGRTLVSGSFGGELVFLAADDLDAAPHRLQLDPAHGSVTQAAFDRAGARLAVGQSDGALTVFPLDADRRPVVDRSLPLSGHHGPVKLLAFADDGRHLLSMGEVAEWHGLTNQQLFVWNLASALPRSCLRLESHDPGTDMPAACWLAGGQQLGVVIQKGAVRVYPADDWVHPVEQSFDGTLLWIGEVPGASELVVCGIDGIWLLDPRTWSRRHVVVSQIDRSYQQAEFSPDGRLVAVAVRDASIRVFECGPGPALERETWSEVANLHKHNAYVRGMLWRRNGLRLVAADHGFLHGWDALARPYMADLVGHQGRVVAIDFAADNSSLVTAGEDGTIRFWDRGTARQVAGIALPKPRRSAVFSPSGSFVLTVGETSTAHVIRAPVRPFDLEQAVVQAVPLTGHSGQVTNGCFVVLDGAEHVVTAARDGNAMLWEAASGRVVRQFPCSDKAILELAVDSHRGWLATGDEAGDVCVFELATGTRLRSFAHRADPPLFGIHGRIRGLWFLPHGRLCATAEDSPATLWSPVEDWVRREVGVGGSTGWVATDHDEHCLAIGELSVSKIMWYGGDAMQAPERHEDREPTSWFSRMAVRRDGDIGLVASRDGSVWLYDWQQRDVYSVLRCNHGATLDACFSPDGKWVAAAYRDGTALVWPVDPFGSAERHRFPMPR